MITTGDTWQTNSYKTLKEQGSKTLKKHKLPSQKLLKGFSFVHVSSTDQNTLQLSKNYKKKEPITNLDHYTAAQLAPPKSKTNSTPTAISSGQGMTATVWLQLNEHHTTSIHKETEEEGRDPS